MKCNKKTNTKHSKKIAQHAPIYLAQFSQRQEKRKWQTPFYASSRYEITSKERVKKHATFTLLACVRVDMDFAFIC